MMHLHIPNPIFVGTEAVCSLGGAVGQFSLALTFESIRQGMSLAQPDDVYILF